MLYVDWPTYLTSFTGLIFSYFFRPSRAGYYSPQITPDHRGEWNHELPKAPRFGLDLEANAAISFDKTVTWIYLGDWPGKKKLEGRPNWAIYIFVDCQNMIEYASILAILHHSSLGLVSSCRGKLASAKPTRSKIGLKSFSLGLRKSATGEDVVSRSSRFLLGCLRHGCGPHPWTWEDLCADWGSMFCLWPTATETVRLCLFQQSDTTAPIQQVHVNTWDMLGPVRIRDRWGYIELYCLYIVYISSILYS